MLPEFLGNRIQLPGIDGISVLSDFGKPGLMRDAPKQCDRYRAHLRRRNGDAKICVASSHRHARLKLNMKRRRAFWLTIRGMLPGKLYGREPRAQKISFQSHDGTGLIECVVRHNCPAERLLVSRA